MTGFQQVACPRCGSAAAVHSIQELAAMASAQLGELPGTVGSWQAGPLPGYLQQPQRGPVPGPAGWIAGRLIGRRLRRSAAGRARPGRTAQREAMLRAQIAIAAKHPDVCACLTDGVVFLAGGRRVLPMPDLSTLTIEQADAMVATLRFG